MAAERSTRGDPEMIRVRLKSARISAGLNQAEVARRIGIDDALLGHYETGARPLREDHLRKWIKVLEQPDDLVDAWLEFTVEERLLEALDSLRKTTRGPLPQEDIDALRRALRNALLGRRV